MKKTSKVFGTVALSAVLAMGTAVPALAADKTSAGDAGYIVGSVEGDDGLPTDTIDLGGEGVITDQEYGADEDNSKQISGAKTEVGVYSSIGQLKVSVPTKMALALEMGGGEFAAPIARTEASMQGDLIDPDKYQDGTIPVSALHYRTGSGYGIENLSGLKVKVTKVQGTERDGFKLKAKGTTTGKNTAATTYAAGSSKATGTNAATIADLCVSLLPSSATTTSDNLAEVILSTTATSAPTTAGANKTAWDKNWTIDRATTAGSVEDGTFTINPVVKGIVVSGSSTQVDDGIGETAITATPAFDIVYTIGVA